jgi:hypothetical protein
MTVGADKKGFPSPLDPAVPENLGNTGQQTLSVLTKIKALKPGQWLTLQSYVLVTGKNPDYVTNHSRWDCTVSSPSLHWTNDVERYCWIDFQAILAAIPATVHVDAPDAVANLWGLPTPPN